MESRLATLEAKSTGLSDPEATSPTTIPRSPPSDPSSISDLNDRVTVLEEKIYGTQETPPLSGADYTGLEQRIASLETMQQTEHQDDPPANGDAPRGQITGEYPRHIPFSLVTSTSRK